MPIKRRNFLIFLGAAAGTTAIGSLIKNNQKFSMPFQSANTAGTLSNVSFKPLQSPMSLLTDIKSTTATEFEVVDDLIVPEGFSYQVIGAWGDKIGDSRFGYNNDYLSFVETAPNEGFLTINFEYISAIPWLQSYSKVLGKELPKAAVEKELQKTKGVNAFALPEKNPLKAQIKTICKEALIDQGMGVISIRKNADGKWERTFSNVDRRITGISGLEDDRYLACTGPAKAVFQKKTGKGYMDKLGDRMIGTFGNCAGGTTPWGTVLSAEENIQVQVPDPVYADGTSFPPDRVTFTIDEEEVSGQGNVFGLAGNKYGWIVEVDPANPKDFGTKHTWLGRYRHEAVGVRVEAGKPLAFYSGCDRRSGHIYKFVSRDPVSNPKDKANSRLLSDGMLYAAKFNEDGTGRWIALKPDTPVNPEDPSTIVGSMINLPKRPDGGFTPVRTKSAIDQYKQKFKTLGDLYEGNAIEKQGAILIDAHYAANACGATCTARPEDTEIAPDGSLYISFTSGSPDSRDGGPDKRVFKGPNGEAPYEYGFVMHVVEDNNDPAAMTFQWKMMAMGGEPTAGGAGFSNPDNLLIDPDGHVWIVTDMSSDKLNKAVPKRIGKNGVPTSQSNLRGLFGNNSLWFVPTSGENAGNAYLFAMAPIEAELTGPFLSRDRQTLFLAVQHPGESNGIRQNLKSETRKYAMKTTDGDEFTQTRQVPIGSNFPDKKANAAPRPCVVVVTKSDRQNITSA
ncbi:PhoX family protein [Leptolyngbya sp. NIES-2104]|uniref:PhoX family protein n=1 Tax=Leptolyngbya sp. NIES-2104 TaxID=1552121 RepID=UPI0006EC899E|nr:alkaline phosphatase PhoX [Leptolyngbya sp. NIES-2104]GAP94582.1 Tat (twin-arginine translocation) pathway signal sequence domain protein [Leptolyngbya sp. NIES-2104]